MWVREGVLVVHSHGLDGGLGASVEEVRVEVARSARGRREVLLLVCEQRAAQQFATDFELKTWASTDRCS